MTPRKTPLITTFELYRVDTERYDTTTSVYTVKREWRWRMLDKRASKIIGASSEGYRRRIDAIANLKRVTQAPVPKRLPGGRMIHQWHLLR